MRLVSVLHDLLICDTMNKEKRDELQKYVYFAQNRVYRMIKKAIFICHFIWFVGLLVTFKLY